MKLRTLQDRCGFFSDINLPNRIIESSDPTNKEMNLFIKKRRELVKSLKDFRKSQRTKSSWRKSRFTYMKGIKKWHKSVAGKKFHRQLGRFLATRVISQMAENDKALFCQTNDLLKAISSLKTHLYLEGDYYMSLEDNVEYDIFIEYASPLINEAESNIRDENPSAVSLDSLEILMRLVYLPSVIEAIEELTGKKPKDFDSVEIDEESSYGYLIAMKSAYGEPVDMLQTAISRHETPP